MISLNKNDVNIGDFFIFSSKKGYTESQRKTDISQFKKIYYDPYFEDNRC